MAMKWIGKVTGGLLGAVVLGPIGAAFGVLLGHQFDETSGEADEPPAAAELATIGERFFRASFQVMGYLAKADGRVSEREISAARAVMRELRLDAAQVREAIACFTAGKQPDYDYDSELAQLGRICHRRPDLGRVFLEIQVRAALEGNDLGAAVRPLMGRLAAALGVSAQVAKAYRRQLQRHHPDKLKAHGLPESMMAHAKQRTQQIIEAWEIVRARRGIR